ncbi:hypothetical protein EDI_041420 [Entamoeba dispar SAW760]|uniref:Uncharacterized protein n=1 Tax=Entamoeba dispar (strain ATCC PRA-260 / SAW760) TaxID=370354 RepID=B0ETQ2_ENTDS|nr:uncharacterized protein EDI_041420 [Entamoeba dispar SAW760]EDR22102.1 hypothetical protein EDI_041420 [Entamoeba dispar SAW760]|eukprot:EDR22102.1 hypothetical protein EDI_041420 [Entamoeba dispar SAW760]
MTEPIDLFGISLYPNEIIPCSLLKELFVRFQDEINKKIQQEISYNQQPSLQTQLIQSNNEIKEIRSELISLKDQFHQIKTQQHEIIIQNDSVHSITQTPNTQQDKSNPTQIKQLTNNQIYKTKLPSEEPLSIGIKENIPSKHKNDIKTSKIIPTVTKLGPSTINRQRDELPTNTYSGPFLYPPSDVQQEVENNLTLPPFKETFQNESHFLFSNHSFYSEPLYSYQPSQPSYSNFLTNSPVNIQIPTSDIIEHSLQNELYKSIPSSETTDKVLNYIHNSVTFFKNYTGKSSYKILFDSNKLKETNSFPSQIFYERCKRIKKIAIFICCDEYLFGVYHHSQLIPSGSIIGSSDFMFSIKSPKLPGYNKFDISSKRVNKMFLFDNNNPTDRNKLFEMEFKFGSMIIYSPPDECLHNEINLIANTVDKQMAIDSCIPKSPFKADRIISVSFDI